MESNLNERHVLYTFLKYMGLIDAFSFMPMVKIRYNLARSFYRDFIFLNLLQKFTSTLVQNHIWIIHTFDSCFKHNICLA